jgi:hypothetical protein
VEDGYVFAERDLPDGLIQFRQIGVVRAALDVVQLDP